MAGIALAGEPESRLLASVVWFPPIDFRKMDGDMELTGVERRTGRNDAAGSPESELIGAVVRDNPEKAYAASPLFYLENLPEDTPLPAFLVMHGAMDPFIARGQSGRLFSALLSRKGRNTLEFVLLPNAGHGRGDFEKAETLQRVISFLKRQMMN
jgi:dipeptidyl aminopeptidase/acylaminoacyl peptidase